MPSGSNARPTAGDGAIGLTIALPKGRVLDAAIGLLEAVGVPARAALARGGRKLHHEVAVDKGPLAGITLRVLVIRDSDLPAYVEHGAADLGVAGLDVIEEHGADLYRPLDLGLGRCRLVVAEPAARAVDDTALVHLRYATKYPRLTRQHLQERGIAAEIVELSGAVELGPVIGLCDRIVDLVESGETLRQHGLREIETVLEVSACVVVNRASLKLRSALIRDLLAGLRAARGAA
jgi:ATP phosphoribosyltransferase